MGYRCCQDILYPSRAGAEPPGSFGSLCYPQFVATFLIDGHNVIGQLPDISLADPDDEDRLVAKLEGHFAHVRGRVVVVFDPGHDPPLDAPAPRVGRIEAVFARPPDSADDVIIRTIREEPNARQLTVVTADREILACARRHRCRVVKTEQFVRRLARRPPQPREREQEKPAPAGDLASDTYLEYWYEYFDVPPEQRDG